MRGKARAAIAVGLVVAAGGGTAVAIALVGSGPASQGVILKQSGCTLDVPTGWPTGPSSTERPPGDCLAPSETPSGTATATRRP